MNGNHPNDTRIALNNGNLKLDDELGYSKVPELTHNAISKMLDGIVNKKIIIQVLRCDDLTSEGRPYYLLALSDGEHAYPLCNAEFDTIEAVDKFAILQVSRYSISEYSQRRFTCLMESKVLRQTSWKGDR